MDDSIRPREKVLIVDERIYSTEELINCVLPLFIKKYKAEHAVLFGSYARQEATARFDIDLVVIGGPLFDSTNVFCIADESYRLTGKDVDIYDVSEINADTSFYHTIFTEGMRIA